MESRSALPETQTGTATRKKRKKKKKRLRGLGIVPHKAEGNILKEMNVWKQVHARGGRDPRLRMPHLSSPFQVPLYNRYEVLDVEGQTMDDMGNGPSTLEIFPRSERPNSCIKIIFTKTKEVISR